MLVPSPFLSASANLLLQAMPQPVRQPPASAADAVLKTAAGLSPAASDPSVLLQAGESGTSALFDPGRPDATAMKARLIERLGEALGLSMDDFESQYAYGMALREIVDGIRMQEDGFSILAEIEEKLGLDELGIPLDTLIDAIVEPGGAADERLDAALKEKAGEPVEEDAGDDAPGTLPRDGIGLYGPWA